MLYVMHANNFETTYWIFTIIITSYKRLCQTHAYDTDDTLSRQDENVIKRHLKFSHAKIV